MSFKLQREIYGNNVWMVDPATFSSMWSLLSDIRNGMKIDHDNDNKCNSSFLYSVNTNKLTDTKNISFSKGRYDLSNYGDDESIIGIINLDGPITKEGGASSHGTKQLSENLKSFELDDRVKGTIIKADSGGGSGVAIQFLRDSMLEANKPIGVWLEKGSMAASAAYGISSAADFIMAENEDVEVGSLGSFMQFGGYPKDNTKPDGYRNIRIYAPDSEFKNYNFEEAINNSNFKPIIDDLLIPSNDKFLSNIKEDRPNIKPDQMNGKMFKAGDVLGSMVDSIGSFDEAVNQILSLSETIKDKSVNNTNINNKQMNKSQLKAENPELYEAIRNEGVIAERERVGSWMAHSQTDMDAVISGIESGEEISPSQREKFLVKQNNKTRLDKMQENNSGDFTPGASTGKTKEELEQEEVDNFYNFK